MYYKDLTKYKYMTKEDSLNIGWLQKGHIISEGDVPEEFLENLWKYLRYPVQVCRGFHVCDFCNHLPKGVPIVEFKGEKRKVGYYEIRVWGKDGKVYAAPSLIFHYILHHGYKPPQEFIDAVMASGDVYSDEYYQKVLEYSNGNEFWLVDDLTKNETFRVDIERERFIINSKDLYIKSSDMHCICLSRGSADLQTRKDEGLRWRRRILTGAI